MIRKNNQESDNKHELTLPLFLLLLPISEKFLEN